MYRIRSRLAAASLALVVAGCSARQGPQVGPLARGGEARVQVTNNNWADMAVYVEGNGTRKRLGMVTSMARRAFEVPFAFLSATGDVRLVADPIGTRDALVTFPVQVWPGQTVDFTIENQLTTSTVIVR